MLRVQGLTVAVARASKSDASNGVLTAYDSKGRSISSAPFEFGASNLATTAEFKLPVELRNEVVRLEVDNGSTAAGVQLLDERAKGDHPDLEWLIDQIKEWLILEKRRRVFNTYVKNLYLQAQANNEIETFDVLQQN